MLFLNQGVYARLNCDSPAVSVALVASIAMISTTVATITVAANLAFCVFELYASETATDSVCVFGRKYTGFGKQYLSAKHKIVWGPVRPK